MFVVRFSEPIPNRPGISPATNRRQNKANPVRNETRSLSFMEERFVKCKEYKILHAKYIGKNQGNSVSVFLIHVLFNSFKISVFVHHFWFAKNH